MTPDEATANMRCRKEEKDRRAKTTGTISEYFWFPKEQKAVGFWVKRGLIHGIIGGFLLLLITKVF